MSFPLFDLNKLDDRPRRPDPQPTPPKLEYGSACPSDPPKPTTYLRDILVALLVLAFLAGVIVLAYYVPTWL
jgi:hypothetical protein